MVTPPRPTANTPAGAWAQWAHDMILSLRPASSPGVKTSITTRGFFSRVTDESGLSRRKVKLCVETASGQFVEKYAWIQMSELTDDPTGYEPPE